MGQDGTQRSDYGGERVRRGASPMLLAVVMLLALVCVASAKSSSYFAIEVVDEATGRGVPMVELQTTSGARYYTDSNGLVAFYEPGLMDRTVWFGVSSHG